jgi:RNA polymerase sigma-70 factor (ECF subfamily)
MNNQHSIVEKFVVDHQKNIYRLAYSYVHNKDDALDIVQESIYKAMKTKAELRDPSELKSWFYRIVVNTALDLLRKRKRVQPTDDEQLYAFMDGVEDAYTDIDLERTLEDLPEMYRTVIVLRFFEDLTLEEVA